jgi:hypothetical protein
MARNRIHNYLDKERAKTTEKIWNEFVGNVLSMELDHVLSVLDGEEFDGLSDEQKQQMRETM